jgi:hypothetical protein
MLSFQKELLPAASVNSCFTHIFLNTLPLKSKYFDKNFLPGDPTYRYFLITIEYEILFLEINY